MKTLVVCIDGTWNTPGQRDLDPVSGCAVETRTNVARTWEIMTGETLDHTRPYGSVAPLKRQLGAALYLSGVGSSGSRLAQCIHGATGRGLAERIRDAYRFLSERWQPGDRVLGFGFSRGAFAVRSLMGFIEAVGLPKTNNLVKERELARLYAMYRKRARNPVVRPSWTVEAPVQFLGLWDTVGALAFGHWINGYHAISPGNVRHVCHAVALDEERKLFWPELWAASNRPGQTVEEVLFAGSHTNVGGGYTDARLSSIPLAWILEQASRNGFRIDLKEIAVQVSEAAFATRRPSYTEFWHRCPVIGPLAARLGIGRRQRSIHARQRVHSSVREAMHKLEYKPIVQGLERLCIL